MKILILHTAYTGFFRYSGLLSSKLCSSHRKHYLYSKDGWKLPARKGYEQLLIPFGVALARSHVSKNKREAGGLLLHILHHKKPFTWRDTSSGLLFIPLRIFLHWVRPETYPLPSMKHLEEFQELSVVTIGPETVY